MSKMTILGPKAKHPGCAFEEYRAGALRGCGRTSFVKDGNVYLCPEHAKYALSTQGEHYELYLAGGNIQVPQKAFLVGLENATRPAPAPAAEETSHDD